MRGAATTAGTDRIEEPACGAGLRPGAARHEPGYRHTRTYGGAVNRMDILLRVTFFVGVHAGMVLGLLLFVR
jgi:hypothetical protein